MFYILENENQLSRLEEMGESGCYVEIVTSNDNFHSRLSELVALYIRPLEDSKGYLLPIKHDEGICIDRERVVSVLQKFSKVYILDKKAGLYFFNLGKNVCDLSLKYAMTYYKRLDINIDVVTYNWFYNRYGGLNNLNQVIPLSKIYEKCERTFQQIEEVIALPEPSGFEFYNEYATKVYFMVEQSGMRVDTRNFIEKFKPTNPDFSIKGETVYTSYNLYNSTSRPTNSFNAVNFLAIPKGIEFRRLFKPVNDMFVEMDFDGYHIRLVSNQVGYPIGVEEKAHKILGRLYTGKETFSAEEYSNIKGLNFKMIYGSPTEECKELEISKKIQSFIDDLWRNWRKGKATNPESGKLFSKSMSDMYPQKVFNYMVQSLETSRNIRVLYRLLRYMSAGGFKSKVILITYDSFLIDWNKEDGEEVLEGIKNIMEQEKGELKYPVGIKRSKDLNF